MRGQFRVALASGAAARRNRRLAGPLFDWPPPEAGTDPAPALGEVAAQGTYSPRLPHQSLDDAPDRRADRARVWSPLSSGSSRAVDAQPAVEPPEARASCGGARRAGH